MTVSSEVSSVSYSGNGSTQIFAVPFYFLADSHLRVILRAADGTETVQVITTNYTVSGAGNPAGGAVTMIIAPASGTVLAIVRNVPATQETDYVANDPFPAESHERALDKLTMLIQQGVFDNGRVLRVPDSDPEPQALPAALQRANLLLSFDNLGNPVAIAPASGSATDLAIALANTNDPAKGVALVGRSAQVIDSVASLRLLSKLKSSSHAITTGYYAQGDGGGATYWLDASDTISADNGGSVIVSADGGRWKLVPVSPANVRQFGAKGDAAADDTAAIQAAINYAIPNGIPVYIPRGVYNISDAGVSVGNVGAGNTGGTQSIKFLVSVYGDGSSSSILSFTGTSGYCFKVFQGGSSKSEFKGFSVLQKGATKQGTGLSVSQTSWASFEEISAVGFNTGISIDDCFSIAFDNCRAEANNVGLTGDFIFVSRPNDIAFRSCNFTNNVNYGATLTAPTAAVFTGGSFEGNGSAANEGGLRILGNPIDGISGLTLSGVYFEGNGGSFDVGIYNSNNVPGIHNMRGCTFNRISNTKFTSANIALYKSAAAQTKLVVDGNGFQGFNTYVPNSARRYIQVPAPVDNNYLVTVGTNIYGSSVEVPVLSGAYAQDSRVGAAVRFNGTTATITGVKVNVTSVVRNGVGDYTVNYEKALRDSANAYSAGFGESFCVPELFSESTGYVRFKTRNQAGTLTDYANVSLIVYGFDGSA